MTFTSAALQKFALDIVHQPPVFILSILGVQDTEPLVFESNAAETIAQVHAHHTVLAIVQSK